MKAIRERVDVSECRGDSLFSFFFALLSLVSLFFIGLMSLPQEFSSYCQASLFLINAAIFGISLSTLALLAPLRPSCR